MDEDGMRYHDIGDIVRSKFYDEETPLTYLVVDKVPLRHADGLRMYVLVDMYTGQTRSLTFHTLNKNYDRLG